jgi:hypothetical protein
MVGSKCHERQLRESEANPCQSPKIIETACHLFLHCDCATHMQQNLIKFFFAVSLLDAVVFARRSLENFGLDDFP